MQVNALEWKNRLPTPLLRVGRFIKLLVSRFIEDQGLPNAASLTFTTLLSLVPLMTVSLAIFAAFPVSDRVEEQIQGFLFENFVPTSSEVL
ncbi:MAG: YhjD/YihY/BrkB family envelope integrity protein, partial [Sedimenticola sp.]